MKKAILLFLAVILGTTSGFSVFTDRASAAYPWTKEFTSFFIGKTQGNINESNKTISVSLPAGSDLSAQVATFKHEGASVRIGNVEQRSGLTMNDFRSPVTYTVIAQDGSSQNYTVTVTSDAPSEIPTSNLLTTYDIVYPIYVKGVVNHVLGTIDFYVPYNTDLSRVRVAYVTNGYNVVIGPTQQVSGVTEVDLRSVNKVTVRGSDDSYRDYTISVKYSGSDAKELRMFGIILDTAYIAQIDQARNTALLTVPSGTNLKVVKPIFAYDGADVRVNGISQKTGETMVDLSSPVVYTVVAEDGTLRSYTVRTTTALRSEKDITFFALPDLSAIGKIDGTTITVQVPEGSSLDKQVPVFITTGAKVTVGGAVQTSAVTAQNFRDKALYTVFAEDGTSKVYTVVVKSGKEDPEGSKTTDPKNGGEPPKGSDQPSKPLTIYNERVDKEAVIAHLKDRVSKSSELGKYVDFSDTGKHWSRSDVSVMVKAGAITWWTGAKFRPDAGVTRGEFSEMVYRLFKLKSDSSKSLKDIKGHEYENAITSLLSIGVMTGYPDGTFKPDKTLTRAELVSILSRLINLDAMTKVGDVEFDDISRTWNREEIRKAANVGLVQGKSFYKFAPSDTCTRGEAAVLLLRAVSADPDVKAIIDKLR